MKDRENETEEKIKKSVEETVAATPPPKKKKTAPDLYAQEIRDMEAKVRKFPLLRCAVMGYYYQYIKDNP